MKEPSGAQSTFSAPRVLVVDDDDAFRGLLTKQLEGMGCDVQSTPRAAEFLGNLSMARSSFDLVVVDIQLPDLNGDQIISWIRNSELSELKTMPILIVTGAPQNMPASLLHDADISVLYKPYEYSKLKATVTRMLRRLTLL